MWSERLLSSLVTRLTLAVLAVLLLSLGVTATVFVTQLHADDYSRAQQVLAQTQTIQIVRARVLSSLLNPVAGHPLARVGPLPIDRVLVTAWPDGAVIGDSAASGGGPPAVPFAPPISSGSGVAIRGTLTLGGSDYVYVALPFDVDPTAPTPNGPSFRDVIMLEHVAPLPGRIVQVVRQLALAGLVAIAISLLAALLALRALTRPLHEMTLASERMAAGDYDQQVTGGDAHDEIGQLARSFNRMATEVKRVREMHRQFIANVSHDLRSPLTSIIGFSQALTDDTASTPLQRRSAEIINKEAQRLSRLTLDLLDLSRLEAGRLPLLQHALDLTTLLHEIAARYQTLPPARGVLFTAALDREPLPIIGDPDRLTQVVGNLLDNALKFCNADGTVRLGARQEGRQALIEVYNTGAGIASEDLSRVFDRFYRGDHSRAQQTGGSGIGLAIVRELVHAHGGEIEASSRLGAWTMMTIRLPLAEETVAADTVFTKDLQVANSGATRAPV